MDYEDQFVKEDTNEGDISMAMEVKIAE